MSEVEGIAIIGMAGRFPGARNIDEFWHNLRGGVESISFFDEENAEEKLEVAGTALPDDRNTVKAFGALDDIDLFDAPFFGFTPREAEITDPQHRLFLECAWQALEDAGYDSEQWDGAIGVYAGVGVSSYAMVNLLSNRDLIGLVGMIQTSINNRTDHLTTQTAYKLNLKGPGVTVQTACSTSLVAVHLACQSLFNGECDMAVAGGVSITVPQKAGYLYQEGGILSPDGHCRPFDARAQGTVPGSGVGIVVLKRLEDALAEGDTIHAVIRGSAINNDGSLKVGYTAPSVDGQAEAIAQALAVAQVDPETITYVETHGTATSLGDPIEIEALTRAFRAGTDKNGFCAIGAVKSNVGHLDTAAGVAGLIKTVLALKHKEIPPSLHYEQPNPQIDFENSPFYVNAKLARWPASKSPRRAGVSSFGLGGTNAHVVLEEAPAIEPSASGRPWHVLMLSARTSAALEQATVQLADTLKQHPDVNLADVAYTLQVGRRPFNHRRAIICQDGNAAEAMDVLDPNLVYTSVQEPKARPVVFMFTGQGSQYVNMGRELYEVEPVFRQHVDYCCQLLQPHLGLDLRHVLYPDPELAAEAAEQLKQTVLTQPALFVIEYALAQLWQSWGVRPEAMIGHSIGEYVAACLAGVFSLEDALALVAARGRLMQSLPGGSMLVVPLSEEEVQPLLNERLCLAAVNGPALCVVSGEHQAIDALEEQLKTEGLGVRRLRTSHAFHSHMMEPILEPFMAQLKKVHLNPPQIPYVANVSGTWITAEEATDPGYWARHIRQAVRFGDGLHELVKEPNWLLLEIGPGRTLMTLARWHPGRAPGQIVLTSLPQPQQEQQSDFAFMLTTLGRLWIAGIEIDWPGFHAQEQRRRLPLPPYPFERQRYWIDGRPMSVLGSLRDAPLLKRPDIADWFYVPSWKRTPLPSRPADQPTSRPADQLTWLLFMDEIGLGASIADRLVHMGQNVVTVAAGESFAERDNDYTVQPQQVEDYRTLIQALQARRKTPNKIIHLWSVTSDATPQQLLDRGFYSLLYLAQALGAADVTEPVQIEVVSNNMQEVLGGEVLYPEKATVIGPCRAIPQEYPNLTCRSIDLAWHATSDVFVANGDGPLKAMPVEQLMAEIVAEPKAGESIIAYRGQHRWLQHFEPMALAVDGGSPRLRQRGVYLITGGRGGIGLELAEYLARTVQARVVLTGRSAFPEREAWDTWLSTHDDQDMVSYKIGKLRAIEAHGGEALVLRADVTDQAEMQRVVDQVVERFGGIHGIIHAAGIAGGGVIQLKTRAMAAEVLAPKVQGTRVLEAVCQDQELDFLALCSSRASILGGFGQVDYCAANAFLDAFAHTVMKRQSGPLTVSINWAGWQEVGMAVDTLSQLEAKGQQQSVAAMAELAPAAVTEIGHPLLATCIEETPEREVYSTHFSVASHWVLDDHRIVRQPIIPGTTYLEMVRAALERKANGRAIELRDVYFLSALPVRDDETKEVRTIIEKNGGDISFRILGKAPAATGETWQEYVMGKARYLDARADEVRHDIQALIDRCNKREVLITDDNPIVTYEDLGPRWQSLRQVYVGDNELVAILELPQAFAADVETFKLHPALLDRANFTAKVFLASEGLHLPLGYRGLVIKRPLPSKIYAYAKYKPADDPLFETITFDAILMDEEGLELVLVDEFSQKRVREVAESMRAVATQQRTVQGNGTGGRGRTADNNGHGNQILVNQGLVNQGLVNQGLVNQGLAPQEGVEAFSRILAANVPPQVIVSPTDLLASIEQVHLVRERRLAEDVEIVESSRPKHERPEVATAYMAPRNELEQAIADIWQETLGIEPIGIHDNFFELGGDSVVGIQMIARFKRTGYQLSPQQLFQNQTIAELAAALDVAQPITVAQGPVTGPVPLLPGQQWFFEQDLPEPHHFNQAMLFDVRQPLDRDLLATAVGHILEHHDGLRLRFELTDNGWQQNNAAPDQAAPFAAVDLSGLTAAEQETTLAQKAAELQGSLNLSEGPLLKVAYFDCGPGKASKVLIIAHYLVIDSISWWILLSDLDTAYQQLAAGQRIQLPPKTTSFKEWAERLTEYAATSVLQQEAEFWLAESRRCVESLPEDRAESKNNEASATTISLFLDTEETQALLHEVPQVYRTVVNDMLLTALVQAVARWTGEEALLVDLEDHGREALFEAIDLSRTVGSLRAVYPMRLDLTGINEPGEALKSVKEQLRSVPHGGIGYGLLRYAREDDSIARQLGQLPQAQVRFSYLGQFDQLLPKSSPLAPAQGPVGPIRSPKGSRSHLLEINGVVHQGRLQIDWTYSENRHKRATIEKLGQRFMRALRALIAHCQSPEAGGYTPSDFPLAQLDQEQLDKIAAKFKA